MPYSVSIVVPNWNGERLLPRALGGMMMSASASGYDYEILVVDDASTDGSVALLGSKFPRVRVLVKPSNTGFGDTANVGVGHARGDVVVLLNNDLVPREPLIQELVSPLEQDARLFAVSGRTLNWRASEADHVGMAARWMDGEFHLTWSDPGEPEAALFPLGGCSAFRRPVFQSLGGFQPVFSPGYWEDYDLGYFAAKSGWRTLYNPHAQAYHFGSVSMRRRHGATEVRALRARNRLLFHWLNITDVDMVREHSAIVAGRFARAAMGKAGEMDWVRGWRRAMALLPEVEAERRRRGKFFRRTDLDVLSEFVDHGRLVE